MAKRTQKVLGKHTVTPYNIDRIKTSTLIKYYNDYEMNTDTFGLIVRELSRRREREGRLKRNA